jgi:hypothetical protein
MHNISKANSLGCSVNLKESRAKARSFMEICKMTKSEDFGNLREFNVEISPTF